jgi:hypothetical protein
MAGKVTRKAHRKDDKLTEVARSIGSTLGTAAARAGQVIEGVKAAARATSQSYKGKKSKAKTAARSKKKNTRRVSK